MIGLQLLTTSGATLALVLMLLLSAPSTIDAREDFYGYVRFFDRVKFDGPGSEYWYYTSDSNYCINLSCFDDQATSIKWKNLPKTGEDEDGVAKIAFYRGKNCTGYKKEWPTTLEDFLEDLSIDKMDNLISSFIIYETGRESKGNVLPCPWGTNYF